MKILFVRHGEPDYSYVRKRGFRAHGLDLAPLVPEGISQIEKTSQDERLKSASLILSSPYTRALQTASILSRNLNLGIQVEVDLHEWLPDKTFTYQTRAELDYSLMDFYLNKGEEVETKKVEWESVREVQNRVRGVLNRYHSQSETLIVACHAMVIKSVVYKRKIDYGEIVSMNYHPDQPFEEWIFEN